MRDPFLSWHFKPIKPCYIVQHEVLKITSRKKADTLLETHIYDVKQLVGKNVKPAIVTNYVTGTVIPKSWSEEGGKGALATLPGYLLVYQTQRAHCEIPKQLEQLKQRLDKKKADQQ